MCGIVGIIAAISKPQGLAIVERMNNSIAYRGPDEQGLWATEGFAFGMRRLSIVDIQHGQQPIWSHDPQEKIGVIFNGEIYNHVLLRKQLINKGCHFKTRSDVEVILKLFELEGMRGLEKLEGMFAICVFDKEKQKVHLIRDRMGIKPLYYAKLGNRFYFASEIKAILSGDERTAALNEQSLHHYLTLRYVPSPDTIWKDIHKLEPGSTLTYDLQNQSWKTNRYWHGSFESKPLDHQKNYVEEFESLFLEAVNSHLVTSDVPVGVLLSGGLDSSAIVAAAHELGHTQLHSFSVGFSEGGYYSELEFARNVAKHVGSQHHEITINQNDFMRFLPQMVRYTDEPLADLAAVPLYYVSKLASQHVKVVISGEGSDELLAGYDMEKLARRLNLLNIYDKLPKFLKNAIQEILPSRRLQTVSYLSKGWSNYLREQTTHMTKHWSQAEKMNLWLHPDTRPSTEKMIQSWYGLSNSRHPLDQLQQVYCHSWLVDDLLMKADRMSMANSVELRVPFLDDRLVAWALSLPMAWKTGGPGLNYVSKKILREFAKKRLPKQIIHRPKRGFPVPACAWLQAKNAESLTGRLLSQDSKISTLFDTTALTAVIKASKQGCMSSAHKIWTLIILEHWMEAWM